MQASREAITAGAEESGTVTLTVTRAAATGSPLDPQLGDAEVAVTAEGVPAGWTVAIDPNGFSLAPGESREVQVTVSIEADAGAEQATIVFRARMESPDPSGVFVPGGETTAAVEVTRDDSATRQFMEALGAGVWIILGVALVAIVLAVFLFVDTRTKVVTLTSVVDEVKVRPGQTASIPFIIENRAKETDRFSISADPGDAEWRAELPIAAATLEAGGTEELHASVTPSKRAPLGSRSVLRVVAMPDHSPRRVAILAIPVLIVD